jgi:hypothetical protein
MYYRNALFKKKCAKKFIKILNNISALLLKIYEIYYRNALFKKKCAKHILPKYIIFILLYNEILYNNSYALFRKKCAKNV